MLRKAKTARLVITLYRHITDKLPTSYRHITNCRPTVGRLSADCRLTDSLCFGENLSAVCRPANGRQSADRFLESSSSQLPKCLLFGTCRSLTQFVPLYNMLLQYVVHTWFFSENIFILFLCNWRNLGSFIIVVIKVMFKCLFVCSVLDLNISISFLSTGCLAFLTFSLFRAASTPIICCI